MVQYEIVDQKVCGTARSTQAVRYPDKGMFRPRFHIPAMCRQLCLLTLYTICRSSRPPDKRWGWGGGGG